MTAMKVYRVRFYSPGTFFAEESSREIDSWDTAKACEIANGIKERYEARPYAFRFETYLTSKPVPDGEGGMLDVQPKRVEESGLHFLGGMLRTYDEVVRDEPDSILASNMRGNGYWIVCVNTNSFISTIPFDETDVVVDASGAFVERGDSPERVAYRARKTKERDDKYREERRRHMVSP